MDSLNLQKKTWDITIPYVVAKDLKAEDIEDCIKQDLKHWVFQKEASVKQAKEGRWHYQFRGEWNERIRGVTIPRKYRCFQRCRVSLTSTGECKKFDYVMKEVTRIEGPWSDQIKKHKGMLTRKVKKVLALGAFPWQESIAESFRRQRNDLTADDRIINVMISPDGGDGRAHLAEWLLWLGLCYEVQPYDNFKEIMDAVIDHKHTGYMIDFPRALYEGDPKALAKFYAGMEKVKDGRGADPRYSSRTFQMESPAIWIFTNSKPRMSLLSASKWALWTTPYFGGPLITWDAWMGAELAKHDNAAPTRSAEATSQRMRRFASATPDLQPKTERVGAASPPPEPWLEDSGLSWDDLSEVL